MINSLYVYLYFHTFKVFICVSLHSMSRLVYTITVSFIKLWPSHFDWLWFGKLWRCKHHFDGLWSKFDRIEKILFSLKVWEKSANQNSLIKFKTFHRMLWRETRLCSVVVTHLKYLCWILNRMSIFTWIQVQNKQKIKHQPMWSHRHPVRGFSNVHGHWVIQL